MARSINIYWLIGCDQWFGWMVKDLEGTLENWWQGNLGKSYANRPLWMGKNPMKTFVSYVNIHQRVTPTEEDFNNQVDKIPILWIPVNLFLQPLLLSPNRLINIVTVSKMEGSCGFGNMDFYSLWPALLLLSPQSASSRDHHWVLSMAPFPRVIHQHLVTGDYIGLFPSQKEQHFVLTGTDIYSIWIYLPCVQYFCPNYHPWTYKKPYLLS